MRQIHGKGLSSCIPNIYKEDAMSRDMGRARLMMHSFLETDHVVFGIADSQTTMEYRFPRKYL